MDDVYDRLKALKAHDESFSDTLRRITVKGSIMEFFGVLEINDQEAARIKEAIQKMRQGTRTQEIIKQFGE